MSTDSISSYLGEDPPTDLTVEQRLRVAALGAATRITPATDATVQDRLVLTRADTFMDWLMTGELPRW